MKIFFSLWAILNAFYSTPVDTPIRNYDAHVYAGVRRYVDTAGYGGQYIDGNSFTYNPGDTLVIRQDYINGGLAMANFHGTYLNKVVIINQGDRLMAGGIAQINCTYTKLTGSGTSTFFGFLFEHPTGQGIGFEITGRSANNEVERIYVHHKAYGAWAKQDANCVDSLSAPNWIMDSINIHDCRFFNIGQDCIYAGSTHPNGLMINCGSGPELRLPLRLANFTAKNLYVDSCNRTGIQLSGAQTGTNLIDSCQVIRTGYELNPTQGSGIILGGLTTASVTNCRVTQTYQIGIWSIGKGLTVINNNYVDSTGYLGALYNPGYASIATGTRGDSMTVIVRNNRVGINGFAQDIEFAYPFPDYTVYGNYQCNNTRISGGAATIANPKPIVFESCIPVTSPTFRNILRRIKYKN